MHFWVESVSKVQLWLLIAGALQCLRNKLKPYPTLCVLYGLSHISWFQGLKYISPSLLPQVTNHNVKSNICLKRFLRSLFNYTTFLNIENMNYLWRSYKDIGVYNLQAKHLRKSTIATSVKIFNIKKPRHVFQHGRNNIFIGRRNMWSKNLDDRYNNIFFWLKVWLFGGWAETSSGQFEQNCQHLPCTEIRIAHPPKQVTNVAWKIMGKAIFFVKGLYWLKFLLKR